MNKASALISRLLSPDPLLFWAYVLPFIYWAYLFLTTNFVLVFDSEDYYQLAQMFYQGHWLDYFKSGPHREPFYPLIVAASMLIGKWMSIPYTYPLKAISFGLLAITMGFIQKALQTIQTRRWIMAAAVFYTGFSPILINSALCLYSEIATFPWLPGTVFFSVVYLQAEPKAKFQRWCAALGVGFCLLCFTMVKGIGELLSPLFMLWLCAVAFRRSGLKILPFVKRSGIIAMFLVFYLPLSGFKSLNWVYNGHFYLTNRADLLMYGNVALRADTPATLHNSLVHLSTMSLSYPLCSRFFSDDQCSYWFTTPDAALMDLRGQMNRQKLSPAQQENTIRRTIVQKYLTHPVREWVYTLEESVRMFFWETTQGPFVVYPSWLVTLFNNPNVLVVMALGAGIFCMIGFAVALILRQSTLILINLLLLGALIIISGIFNVISRYAIMAGPLMILLNASCLSVLTHRQKHGGP